MAKKTGKVVNSVHSAFEIGGKRTLPATRAGSERSVSRQRNSNTVLGFAGGATEAGTGMRGTSSSPRQEDIALICNITDQTWLLNRTHGTYTVSAREVGQDYSLTPISGRVAIIDHGDHHRTEIPLSPKQIAEDLTREINSDAGEASYFGVFVCEGSAPTDEELIEAHEKLEAFYRVLVASADRQWERTHNVVLISDLERRAAKALKLEKDWCCEAQQRVECPACGEKLKPGVAVCRICGAVLDRKKAAEFGLADSGTPKKSGVSSASTAN